MESNQQVKIRCNHGDKIGEKYRENIRRNIGENVMVKIMENTIGEHNWRNQCKLY